MSRPASRAEAVLEEFCRDAAAILADVPQDADAFRLPLRGAL